MSATTRRGGATTEAAGQLLVPGLFVGIGLMAAVDEAVFHQLLHWHHFYDRSTLGAGLFTDGLLHILATSTLVFGVYLATARSWRARAAAIPRLHHLWGGALAGAGAFQITDGLIIHKVLRFHQIRPTAADWLPYDIGWNLFGAALLALGLLVLRGAAGRAST